MRKPYLIVTLGVVGLVTLAAISDPAVADSFPTVSRVYVDETHGVHAVTSDGRNVQVTTHERGSDPQVGPDKGTIGWLVVTELVITHGSKIDRHHVRETAQLYRDGKMLATIKPGLFIRQWTFWQGGTQVAVYSGPFYGPGVYTLFDVETGAVLAESRDPLNDNSPGWVKRLFGGEQLK